MIVELSIKDFILIRDVKLRFDEGFNILTGETGAGKSMVLGAINMVLGAPANKDAVRLGAEKAVIRASFMGDDRLEPLLEELDIPSDEEILIITREIQTKGKSLSRVNGQVVTLNQLRRLTDQLIGIHGQNEHQSLLEKDQQLELLDAFGGETLLNVRQQTTESYSKMQLLSHKLLSLEEMGQNRNKQMDFLNYQINEIEQAKLSVGEDIALEKEFEYLGHLEQIRAAVDAATQWLSGEYGDGASGALSQINGQFRKLEGFSETMEGFSARLKDLYYIMEDLTSDLSHYREKLERDPERHHQVERRLDEINALKSKYGKTIEDILENLMRLTVERATYEQLEEQINVVRHELDLENQTYQQLASKLTALRSEASKRFEASLETELQQLNMKTTTFKVEIDALRQASAKGMDDIEFVISTNIGQPFRPLKKVVSGGELSRVMLGIKIVLGQIDQVPTLVFDEVDAGISGITANIVGEKLSRLSRTCQIICITHLPQIAVFADHHYLIEKADDGQSTETRLIKLDASAIELEISRLVGGASLTELTTTHAREMLASAAGKKQ